MNDRICGTCSLCGGAVTCPSVWLGVIPPTPTCSRCGAVPVQSHGPVIPMRPQTHRQTFDGTTVPTDLCPPFEVTVVEDTQQGFQRFYRVRTS